MLVRVTMADLTSELYRSGPAFSSSFVDLWISTTQLELNMKIWRVLWIYMMEAITQQLMIIVIASAFLLIYVWDRGLTTVIPHQLFTPFLFWYGHL